MMKLVVIVIIFNSLCEGASSNEPLVCPDTGMEIENGVKDYMYIYGIGAFNLKYECNDGYVLVGLQVLVCLPNGEWSGTKPSCVKKCPHINGFENGMMESSFHHATGKMDIRFVCNDGFMLIGSQQLTCLADGEWSDSKPECIPDTDSEQSTQSSSPETESSQNCEDKQWVCATVFQFYYKEFGASKQQECESKFVSYACCSTCKVLATGTQ